MKTNEKTAPPARLNCLYARIAKERIGWLKFILEGYDGLGTLSTVDRPSSLICLKYFPDCREELVALLETSHDTIANQKPNVKHEPPEISV